MIFYCGDCHYLFADDNMPDRCPDCGHTNIRPADQSEQQEFLKRKTVDVWSEEPTV